MSRENVIQDLVRQADFADREASAAEQEEQRLIAAHNEVRKRLNRLRNDAFTLRCAIELIAGTPQSKFRQTIINNLRLEKVG